VNGNGGGNQDAGSGASSVTAGVSAGDNHAVGAPERPAPVAAEPAPFREPPAPRPADTAGSSSGSEGKYVVWSSAPSDVPRSGPDER
jgi:hypothetical protein